MLSKQNPREVRAQLHPPLHTQLANACCWQRPSWEIMLKHKWLGTIADEAPKRPSVDCGIGVEVCMCVLQVLALSASAVAFSDGAASTVSMPF